MTQQGLTDPAEIHVNQIKRFEAGTAQPTLDALVRVAKAMHVSLDALVFDESTRGPDEELRLQFEAVWDFSDEEKAVTKTVLEGLFLKHDASRFA